MTASFALLSACARLTLLFAALFVAFRLPCAAAKVFERCELARVLRHQHHLDLREVANWVCIAQHSSAFNTEAYAGGLAGGSHGLFQISDVYWCSPPGKGFACNLPCERLRDANLTDDLNCLHIIHAEHQRSSGDGYNAWNAYQQFCQHSAQSYIQDCFANERALTHTAAASAFQPTHYTPHALSVYSNAISSSSSSAYSPHNRGKVYDRCELAQELYYKHKMPMEEIPTWVCIAQHEANFDTAAVGRLNADGSADHGLFQISDLYWCAHDRYSGGKACGLQCDKLLDDDLTDDIRCVRRIHGEHTRISGDGFTAWTVYDRNCRDQQYELVAPCFKQPPTTQYKSQYGHGNDYAHTTLSAYATQKQYKQTQLQRFQGNLFLKHVNAPITHTQHYSHTNTLTQPKPHKGKFYNRCELAQELYFKHKFPMQDIATWVCIAQHESNYDTSAVGRLNGDGSADHGLFQISDLYWCTHDDFGGKGCQLPCAKLLDADLADDVECVRTIHAEHTRISGDGFTAWTVYNRNCRDQQLAQVATCFDGVDLSKVQEENSNSITTGSAIPTTAVAHGKIYKECELAQELYYKHKLPIQDIPTWVCIAKYESSYNTSAVGRFNADGSADHGLFQISDLYWCTHDNYGGGKACNIPCHKLIDSDLSDDIECIKTIYAEHTRISGDGFTAWTVYNPHCRNQSVERIASCLPAEELQKVQAGSGASVGASVTTGTSESRIGKGKIYKKCELAQELYFKHKFPMKDVATWVCIAQHESSYNTAAVGRLNTDGSADHGLFQISDLYWCAHDKNGGKACHISCNKLLDNDITDDVRCVRTIYEEHTRISGDGFTAWTVYNHHCRNQQLDKVATCFDSKEIAKAQTATSNYATISSRPNAISTSTNVKPAQRKVYKRCELAQELFYKHKIPLEQIPTWVCIAQRESSYDTSAVGRLNADGSADHGLFQISDLYWCTHDDDGGKACNIPCSKLIDADISDDVRCVRIIYEEHTRISGDGFTAWTVYNPYCRHQQLTHVADCFDSGEIAKSSQQLQTSKQSLQAAPQTYNINQIIQVPRKPPKVAKGPLNHPFVNNPFLSQFNASVKIAATTLLTTTTTRRPMFHVVPPNEVVPAKTAYAANPFLQKFISSDSKLLTQTLTVTQKPKINTQLTHLRPIDAIYASNPFLNKLQYSPIKGFESVAHPQNLQLIDPKQKYHANPFLSKYTGQVALTATGSLHLHKQITVKTTQPPYKVQSNAAAHYLNNPFLQKFAAAPTKPSRAPLSRPQPQTQPTTATPASTEVTKLHVYPTRPYVSSDRFRTTPYKYTTTAHVSVAPTTSYPSTIKPTSRTTTPTRYTTQRTITETTKQSYFTTLLSSSTTSTTTRRPTTTTTVIKKPTISAQSTRKPTTSVVLSNAQQPGTTTTWNWYQKTQVNPTKSPSTQRTTATTNRSTLSSAGTKSKQTTTRFPSTQKTAAVISSTPKAIATAGAVSSTMFQTSNIKSAAATTKSTATALSTNDPTPTTRRVSTTTKRPVTTTARSATSNAIRKPITEYKISPWTWTQNQATANTTKNAGAYIQPATTQKPGRVSATQRTATSRSGAYIQSNTFKNPAHTVHTLQNTTSNRSSAYTFNTRTTNATTKQPTAKISTTATAKTTSRNAYSTKTLTTSTTKRLTTPTTTRRPKTTTKTTTTKRPSTNTTRTTTTTRKSTSHVRTSTSQRTANNITTKRPTQTSSWHGFTTKVPFTTRTTKSYATYSNVKTQTATQKSATTTKPFYAHYNANTTQTTKELRTSITRSGPNTTRRPGAYFASESQVKQQVQSQNTNRTTSTTTKSQPTNKIDTTTLVNPYKNDPFSHPFFTKYNERLKVFASTTTRRPFTFAQYQPRPTGQESVYFQQFRNHTSGNAKSVYAYTFGQDRAYAGRHNSQNS